MIDKTVELLKEFVLACEDPAFSDERLNYVEVQIDKDLLDKAKAHLKSLE